MERSCKRNDPLARSAKNEKPTSLQNVDAKIGQKHRSRTDTPQMKCGTRSRKKMKKKKLDTRFNEPCIPRARKINN